jgi:pilus assembly protein Flp/PilA
LLARCTAAWGADPRGRRKEGAVDIRSFMRDEEGQGLVEYGLIIAVIAIAVIVSMIFLRGQITNIFSNIGNNLT